MMKQVTNLTLFLITAGMLLSCGGGTTKDQSKKQSDPWKIADQILDSIQAPEFPDHEVVITDFGAQGDGITDCTEAIKTAIEQCHADGGGKVIIPEGTFLTGAIHLESNVNLHISEGATLLFSEDKSKFLPVVYTRFEGMELMNYSPFIYAFEKENIAITGKGTVDGQGEGWWSWKGKRWSGGVDLGWREGMPSQLPDVAELTQMVKDGVPVEERVFGEGHYLRPNFIQPYRCKNILIEDIYIKGSPMWIIHPVLSENITVRGVRIESLGPNNDGCNPESSRNVLIENCYFDTGDDCIAIKSGRNEDGFRIGVPSENIIIRDCHMVEGHGGVVMGSEISGNVRYVFAEDCIMDSPHLERAIRIKSNSLRGGIVEHLYVRNIQVKQVKEAVLKINMHYADGRGDRIPLVRNIQLENVTSENSEHGIWIRALEGEPASNILLKDCRFNNVEKDNIIENVDNLVLENVMINGEQVTYEN